MSYFVAGFGPHEEPAALFEKLLGDFAPASLNKAPLMARSGLSYLASYGRDKVIRDRLVRDEESGSWLALIGTPITHSKLNAESITSFLKDPAAWLREQIDGNCAAFAYDAPGKRLIAATDFNSTIPVFYSTGLDYVVFASHELPLARLVNAKIDPFGFSQAIHLGATWGSQTRFSNVHKLRPCEICYVSEKGEVRTEFYWRPHEETVEAGGLDDHIGRWASVLRQSVWNYHESSSRKPVIADFTAGEDGRLLLAQCHALRIPYQAHVTGLETDTDVVIARRAAKVAGFDLLVRPKHQVTREQLLSNAFQISLQSDAYQDFFKSCTEFATDLACPLDDYGTVKYCGLPGGEAFRGSYYLRGKALFPASRSQLDYQFFTKLKYLLDFQPGLMKFSNEEFLDEIHKMVKESLAEVTSFPIGTQIDHLLRMFQTALLGLKYKNPVYLPLATGPMTRSIYWLSPQYKQGGRVTKACTENLFPALAFVKTQNGVPTVRKTFTRLPLFMPEYVSLLKKATSGTFSRLLKWTKPNKWYSSDQWTTHIISALLSAPPYSDWFSSADRMISGHLYNPEFLDSVLKQAKAGMGVNAPILGRIVNMELACRWVSRAQ